MGKVYYKRSFKLSCITDTSEIESAPTIRDSVCGSMKQDLYSSIIYYDACVVSNVIAS